jgi:hypothetical protein
MALTQSRKTTTKPERATDPGTVQHRCVEQVYNFCKRNDIRVNTYGKDELVVPFPPTHPEGYIQFFINAFYRTESPIGGVTVRVRSTRGTRATRSYHSSERSAMQHAFNLLHEVKTEWDAYREKKKS